MKGSPFKFLDSFTKEDKDTFFGRDGEIERLHSSVFENDLLLVYGVSGTGKSSLIQCGLANKFEDSDWLPISVRRGLDINKSLADAIQQAALTPLKSAAKLTKSLRSLYLDHFKPIYLIFDQFEELFIFGTAEEKERFVNQVASIIEADLQCRFIFVIREEYLASLTEFEPILPSLFSNRIRIEKMTRTAAVETITGPCEVHGIKVEEGFAKTLLEKLSPDKTEIELTYLQVFLDKLYRVASKANSDKPEFTLQMLKDLGRVGDILSDFLEEQIGELEDSEIGLSILKTFVSLEGTKKQINTAEIAEFTEAMGKSIASDDIDKYVNQFVDLRILRDKDENGKYELRHDSLANKIYEKITLVEKELLEIREFMVTSIAEYEKRGVLLREDDLSYIAPYEDKLFLSRKFEAFIQESKDELQKVKKRRRNLAIAAVAVLITVMSGFTFWALKERAVAIEQADMISDLKKQLEGGSMLFNRVDPIVLPLATYVMVGDSFRADIFLAASDSLTEPVILVGDFDSEGNMIGDYDTVNIVKGIGKFAVPATEIGQITWKGVINQPTSLGIRKYPFESRYQVAVPSINVSASKMNVMYVGLENPISVAVSGFPADRVLVSVSGVPGTIRKDERSAGGYIVVVDKPGMVYIDIEVNVAPGQNKKLGRMMFRAKRVPEPIPSFMSQELGGEIEKSKLLAAAGILCKMKNFDFNVKFKITSFEMRMMIEGEYRVLASQNNRLTSEMKALLKKVKIGDYISFENMTYVGKNIEGGKLGAINLKVIE